MEASGCKAPKPGRPSRTGGSGGGCRGGGSQAGGSPAAAPGPAVRQAERGGRGAAGGAGAKLTSGAGRCGAAAQVRRLPRLQGCWLRPRACTPCTQSCSTRYLNCAGLVVSCKDSNEVISHTQFLPCCSQLEGEGAKAAAARAQVSALTAQLETVRLRLCTCRLQNGACVHRSRSCAFQLASTSLARSTPTRPAAPAGH